MKAPWLRRQALALHIVRALAFVGVVAVAALVLRRPVTQAKPRVEHSIQRSAIPADDTATFEPEWLLSHRDELHLTARQIQELQKLQKSYGRVMFALTRERDAKRRELARLLDAANQRGAVASSQLQPGLAELAQVQEEIAGAKRRFREAARRLLTPEQQG